MMNKLLNKICIGAAVLCSASVISSCTAGLTYEEAPESVYSEERGLPIPCRMGKLWLPENQ